MIHDPQVWTRYDNRCHAGDSLVNAPFRAVDVSTARVTIGSHDFSGVLRRQRNWPAFGVRCTHCQIVQIPKSPKHNPPMIPPSSRAESIARASADKPTILASATSRVGVRGVESPFAPRKDVPAGILTIAERNVRRCPPSVLSRSERRLWPQARDFKTVLARLETALTEKEPSSIADFRSRISNLRFEIIEGTMTFHNGAGGRDRKLRYGVMPTPSAATAGLPLGGPPRKSIARSDISAFLQEFL